MLLPIIPAQSSMNVRNFIDTLTTKTLFISKRALLIGIILFYVLSLKFHFISVLLVMLLFGLLYPSSWTLARRIIFGFITFLVSNILISYIFFYLHIPLIPLVLESLYGLIALFLLLKQKKVIVLTPLLSANDLCNFIVPAAIFIFFIAGISHYPNGLRIPIVTEGDSAQHFTMTRMAIDQKSILYRTTFYQGTPVATQDTYPPAFYINASILYTSLLNHPYPIQFGRLINLFYLFNYLIIGLIIYVITLLIEIHESENSPILHKLPTLSFLFFFTFSYMLLYQFITGFSPQIFTILLFLIFLYALMKLNEKQKFLSVGIILVLNFVVPAGWYIMAPVTIAMSIYYIYRNFSIPGLIMGVIAIPLSLIPMYYDLIKRLLQHDLKDAFVTTIGVNNVDYDLLIKLFGITFIYLFLFRKMKKNFYFVAMIIICALYSFSVLLLEIYLSGVQGYYYYKSLHFLIILFSIAVGAAILYATKFFLRYIPTSFHALFVLFTSTMIIFYLFTLYSSSFITTYLRGNLKVAVSEQNVLIALASNQKYERYQIIPFSTNFLIHLWSQGFFPNISHFESDQAIWNVSTSSDTVATSQLIENYVNNRSDKRPILFVDFSCYAKTFNNLPKIATLSAEKKIEVYPPDCNVLPAGITPTPH